MKKGFIFDINKCVGCQACVVACQIENYTVSAIPWREVSVSNIDMHPDIPLFDVSMACNHCEDAPCMKFCPALAYTRDEATGAVLHEEDHCIGCKYCTWVCPYDAPKYNPVKGVVEKCNLCVQRVSQDLKTACASACPVGALDFGFIDIEPNNDVNGFSEVGIKPGIKMIPLRKKEAVLNAIDLNDQELDLYNAVRDENKTKTKISLKDEWGLAFFTFMVSLLVAFFVADYFEVIYVNQPVFIGFGIAGMLLSSMHLGNKKKAYRAIFNIRNSWLSREILFYSLFIGGALVSFYFEEVQLIGILTMLSGFLALISIDNVYRVAQTTQSIKYHSASVVLTFFEISLFLMHEFSLFILVAAIKLGLYLFRKNKFRKMGLTIYPVLSLSRIVLGFVVPICLLWYLRQEEALFLILSFVLVGELIDRMEFYLELDIVTPKKVMEEEEWEIH